MKGLFFQDYKQIALNYSLSHTHFTQPLTQQWQK